MSERDRLLAAGPPPPYDGGYGVLPPPPPYYNPPGPGSGCTTSSSVVHGQQPVLVQPSRVCHTVVVHRRRPVVAVTLPPPPDYMYLAIISVLFCFPIGLLAVSKSVKVRTSLRDGDICAAYRSAHQSRLLSRFAITLGVLLTVAIVLPSILVPLICNDNN